MAKELLTNFPQKLGFGTHGKKEDAVQTFPTSVASGGYRPRKPSAPLEQQVSMSLINKGLLNPTGENNCFLNSAVQILWHLDVFRRSFRSLKGHTCVEEACIFCALKELFKEFQHSGQSAIPPDILRKAMAECYEGQNRFQLGLMDDAAECFEKLLEQIHFHLTGSEDMESCGVPHCLSHEKFALTILERTECTCGATSEPLSFVQFVHYISSSAIVKETQKFAERERGSQAHRLTSTRDRSPDRGKGSHTHKHSHQEKASAIDVQSHTHLKPNLPERSPMRQARNAENNLTEGSDVSSASGSSRPRLLTVSQDHFGKILNKASSVGEYRKCPDYDRCKKSVLVKRILLNCPDVVCLGMIWDSDQPSVEDIMSVVYSIGLKLQLNDLFDHVFSDGANINQYELTALIAYYGRHYSTFCYHSKMHEWIYFDDARFRKVGAQWSDVCEEIRKAHYQPLLLVYTNPFAEEINLSEAPQRITKIQQRDQHGNKASTSSNGESASSKAPATTLTSINEESSTSAGVSPPVAPLQTHTIDPMTLSIRPLSRKNAQRSPKPVVDDNSATATSGSQGNSTLSAAEVARLNNSNGSGDNDLMTFSITPSILGKMGVTSQTKRVPSKDGRASPEQNDRQSSKNGDDTLEDLIEFSLTPAMLDRYKSSAIYNRGSRTRLFEDSKRSPSHSASSSSPFHSPSVSPFQSPSISPSRSKKQLVENTTRPTPISSGTNLSQFHSSTSRTHSQFHSSAAPTSSKPPHPPSSTANIAGLNPKWDYFGNHESASVLNVPPQKLLPKEKQQQQQPHSQVDATKLSNQSSHPLPAHDRNNEHRRYVSDKTAKPRVEEKKKIELDWTMVTKTEPSSEDDSAALRQLRRIVSQPGFEDVGEALVPMGKDMQSPELALSNVHIPPENGSQTHNTQPPASASKAIPPRRKADPLPSVPAVDKSDPGNRFHKKWFPEWERQQKTQDVHAKPENVVSRVNKKDKLDYADLDLMPGYETVRSKQPEIKSAAGSVDYTEISFQPPASGSGSKKKVVIEDVSDDYSRLVDVETNVHKMKKTSAMPLGYDPDYAIPEQVLSRLQQVKQVSKGESKGTEHVQSRQPQALNPLTKPQVSTSRKSKETGQSSHQESPHHQVVSPHSGDLANLSKYLSGKVKGKYQEALSIVAVAEASRETDSTVAMMLFQKAAGMFLEVLQDPSVKDAPVIHDKIKTQREEATKNSVLLQKKEGHVNSWETCKRCGLQRYLDDNMLCGPCQLREKMKRK